MKRTEQYQLHKVIVFKLCAFVDPGFRREIRRHFRPLQRLCRFLLGANMDGCPQQPGTRCHSSVWRYHAYGCQDNGSIRRPQGQDDNNNGYRLTSSVFDVARKISRYRISNVIYVCMYVCMHGDLTGLFPVRVVAHHSFDLWQLLIGIASEIAMELSFLPAANHEGALPLLCRRGYCEFKRS